MKVVKSKKGMTLIELILVMAVLATVMAVSTPMLSRFIRGRALQEEARRMLALTRYARSEAVSRSIPMELWFEPQTGNYGLSPSAGYRAVEREEVEFSLSDDLDFEIDEGFLDEDGLARILYWPDGSIDRRSLNRWRISDDRGDTMEIVKADYGLGYIILDEDDEERWNLAHEVLSEDGPNPN